MLKAAEASYHYIDGFQGAFADPNNQIGIADVGRAFFTAGPQWIGKLFALRNRIVRVLGLKASDAPSDWQEQLHRFRGEPGEQLGLFKVLGKTANEIVLGEDDKHLDFRVSLLIEPQAAAAHTRMLTISTTVTFNHWFGRLYFLLIRPFHRAIVPSMLNGIIRKLQALTPPN